MATNKFCDPALGTGANDGTTWANAWQSLQTAADNAVAGDHVFCEGTETLTAQIDFDTNNGTSSSSIKFVAVNTSRSADPWDDVDGTFFTVDANSAVSRCIDINPVDYLDFINFSFINSTTYGVESGVATVIGVNFWGCDFSSNGSAGWFMGAAGDTTQGAIVQCSFSNNTGDGVDSPRNCLFTLCEFIGNGGMGLDCSASSGGVTINSCIFHNNTSYGAFIQTDCNITGCVFDGNTSGIYTGLTGNHAFFNRFTNNSRYGIEDDGTGGGLLHGFNAYYNNTLGEVEAIGSLPPLGITTATTSISMAADGYVNLAGDNFALSDAAEFRRRALNVGSYSV